MLTTLTRTETSTLIDGPTGKLEVALSAPTEKPRRGFAVVCHPHPLHGGNMHNKVVTTLVRLFQHLGLYTVRFNFRGVGQSEGFFDEGRGEVKDLLAVIDWVRLEHPDIDVWLAGFSFGSFVAAQAALDLPVKQLVTVAPPVEHFPMRSLPPILCPWVIVQGELDEVVPPAAVFDWAEHRNPKPTLIRLPKADHFFHGQLQLLRAELEAVLKG